MACSGFRAKSHGINSLLVLLLVAFIVLSASTVAAVEKDNSESGVDSIQKTLNQSAALPTAVLWYQEKAKNGDAEAQYNLGNVYEIGFGVEVSYELAAKWYKEAAEQEHQLAQLKLGMLYILGKGVRESTLKGGKWIRSAARQGNSVAQTLQDKVLSHNIQQDFDVKALVESVRMGLEKGETNAEETIKLALQKIERISRDAPQDSRFVKGVTGSGAKKGSVGNRVPSFLDKNQRKATDIDNSLAVIRRHAKEGVAEAQYELARLYDKGKTVERSRSEAMKWYIAAANQGHGAAQYRVGLAYLYGLGAKPSIGTARKWLNKAKLANDSNAKLFLEYMSLANSTSIDKTIALSWYLERSLKGDGEAMLALGNMYENGWGVNQDTRKAKKWYVKARVAGTKGAAIQLRRLKADTSVSEEKAEEPEPPAVLSKPVLSKPLVEDLVADSTSTNKSSNIAASKNTTNFTESKPPRQSREKNRFNSKQPQNRTEKHENLGAVASINRVFSKLVRSAKNARDAMFQKAKENSTPLILALVGVLLGGLVFRWMRSKEETDETSVF